MTDLKTSAWPNRREWLLIFGFWGLLTLLVVMTRVFDPREEVMEAAVLWPRIGRTVSQYFLWAILTPFIFWIAAHFVPDRQKLFRPLLIHLGIALVISITVDLSLGYLRVHYFPTPRTGSFRPLDAIIRFWFLDNFMIYGAILATGIARVYYKRQREGEAEAQELRTQKAELEAQLSQAQLNALRMQLNPHFLFNTLHSISTLVGTDPKGVRRMIARLSDLLRHVLEESDEQEVSLRKEMRFLHHYLDIQEVRFQGHFDVEAYVEPGVQNALVPTLLLQPIVENAVKHGTSEQKGVGHIIIRASRDDDMLMLSVSDNGPGLKHPTDEMVFGTGLSNVRARLQALYGDVHDLTFHTSDNGGLKVVIRLPYHEAGDLFSGDGDGDAALPSSLTPQD